MKIKSKILIFTSLVLISVLSLSCSLLYSDLKKLSGDDSVIQQLEKLSGEVITKKTTTKSGSEKIELTVKLPNGTVTTSVKEIDIDKSIVVNSTKKDVSGNVLLEYSSVSSTDDNNVTSVSSNKSINYGTPNLKEIASSTIRTLVLSDDNSDFLSALESRYNGVSAKIEAANVESVVIEDTYTVITDSIDAPYATNDTLVVKYPDGSKDIFVIQENESGTSFVAKASYLADGTGVEVKTVYDDEKNVSKIIDTEKTIEESTKTIKVTTVTEKSPLMDILKKTIVEKYLADSEEVIYDLDGNIISDNECLLTVSEREYTSPASWSQHSDTVGFESKPFIIQSVDENQEIEVYSMEEITGKAKIGTREDGEVIWCADKDKAYLSNLTTITRSDDFTKKENLKKDYTDGGVIQKSDELVTTTTSTSEEVVQTTIDYVKAPYEIKVEESFYDRQSPKNLLKQIDKTITNDKSGNLVETVTITTDYKTDPIDGSYTKTYVKQDSENHYVNAEQIDYTVNDDVVEVRAGSLFTATIPAAEDISAVWDFNQQGKIVVTVPSKYTGITWTWLGESSMNGSASGNTYTFEKDGLLPGVYSLYIEDNAGHSCLIAIPVNKS